MMWIANGVFQVAARGRDKAGDGIALIQIMVPLASMEGEIAASLRTASCVPTPLG